MNKVTKRKNAGTRKLRGGIPEFSQTLDNVFSSNLLKKEDQVIDVDKMYPDHPTHKSCLRTLKKKEDALVDVNKSYPDPPTRKSRARTQKKKEDAFIDVNKSYPDPPPPVESSPVHKDIYSEYLGGVSFGKEIQKETQNEIKDIIMKRSFGSNSYFIDLFEKIKSVIPPKKEKKKWVDCLRDCFSQTHNNALLEIKSTAYLLRVLTNSVVGDTKNNKIIFSFSLENKENITGIWEKDKEYFKMKILTLDGSMKVNKGRLIMGLGPSASGKTYSAKKVIELMYCIDNEFPKFFTTIDGGVFREESEVYQMIIKAVSEKNEYDGLQNLVSASVLSLSGNDSIFQANIIKKAMKNYLKEQKEKENFVVSLYVPDTLTGCVRKMNCVKSYEDYIDITEDKNWIGLMIFQHRTNKDCPYKDIYKCKGTTESGELRQISEGKKYSSLAWDNSYKNGNEYINHASTYRFRIHNSGRSEGITLFEDLSPNKIDMHDNKVSNFFKESNWQYVNGKLKNSIVCQQYSDKC